MTNFDLRKEQQSNENSTLKNRLRTVVSTTLNRANNVPILSNIFERPTAFNRSIIFRPNVEISIS